jgi:hypothetical protein
MIKLAGQELLAALAGNALARYRSLAMTAKEKLRATVEELSETEAADALGYIASRRHGENDALGELLENAPLDDEPATPEEEEGLREAREQVARGDVISAEEIRHEFA